MENTIKQNFYNMYSSPINLLEVDEPVLVYYEHCKLVVLDKNDIDPTRPIAFHNRNLVKQTIPTTDIHSFYPHNFDGIVYPFLYWKTQEELIQIDNRYKHIWHLKYFSYRNNFL